MKKRKLIQTDFIKFILEKYASQGQAQSQGLPDDEVESPDEDPIELKRNKIRKMNEIEDEEEPIEGNEDDEIIDELLNEYKRLKRKYESKSNRIYFRRKQ
jgi:hypothetical protein